MVDQDTLREQEIRRAKLLTALRVEISTMASNLYGQLGGMELPNHRLNGIANSFAWHAKRLDHAARLTYGIEEIKRLQQRIDRKGAEYAVYGWLLSQIGSGSRPSADEQKLLDPLRLADNEVTDWLNHVRLLRAQSLLQLLIIFTQSKTFTKALTKAGGQLQWN